MKYLGSFGYESPEHRTEICSPTIAPLGIWTLPSLAATEILRFTSSPNTNVLRLSLSRDIVILYLDLSSCKKSIDLTQA